jgi:beta-fructofuranosidase
MKVRFMLLAMVCLLLLLAISCALAQTDPRTFALADWYLGNGISGEAVPLTSSGAISYNVVPTGLGARPNLFAAQLTSAYFNAGTNLGVSGNQVTVYLRVQVPNGNWNSGLFAKRGSLSTLNYNLFGGTTGTNIGFEVCTANGFVSLSFPVSLIAPKAWHNLVGRYDGTNVQLFCNDRLMASAPLTGNLVQNTEPTLIGAETDSGSIVRPFTGFIEEAALWNTALNSDQLAYLNNLTATNDAYPTQLLHYRDPNHDIGDVHVRSVNGNWALTYLYTIGTNWYQSELITCDFLHFTSCTPTHAPISGSDLLPTWFAIESIWDPYLNKWRSVWGDNGMRSSISDDRFNWYAATPQLLLPDPGTYLRFSDPSFTQVASNLWQMVITMVQTNFSTGGAVGWATSSNLTQWTFQGNLFFPGNRGPPECPTLFNMGSKWYLLSSWYAGGVGCPTYEVADAPSGPWSEFSPNSLDGKAVCAATSDSDGSRRILFGWIPLYAWYLSDQHWGGHLSFPREIFQIANGALRSQLPADFDGLIRGPQLFPGLANPSTKSGNWVYEGAKIDCYSGTGSGTNRAILPGLFDRFEADTTFTPSSGTSRVGWLINWQESGSFYEVGLDVTNQLLFIRYAGGIVWDSLNVPVAINSQHRLRVIVEQDIVEVVYDEQFTLAERIPTQLLTTSLGLFVDNGPVDFGTVTVSRLNNLQSIPSATPTVNIASSASNVVVNFTGILQSAGQLPGPFTDSAGPISPLTLSPTGASQFWRARSP